MILMWRPAAPSTDRITSMSLALRTKDAAIMSTPYLQPKLTRSSRSFSVIVGRSTMTPGRFMFFFSPMVAALSTLTTTPSERSSLTSATTLPSAMRIDDPTVTDRGSDAYEQLMRVLSPSSV